MPDNFQILIVEDNRADVLLVREALKEIHMRFELRHVGDGEAAILFVRALPLAGKRPDLVLLDLNLPKRDGWEVLSEIRADSTWQRVPVVILSSSGSPLDMARAHEFDRTTFIRKPPGFDEYLQVGGKIQRFLASFAL